MDKTFNNSNRIISIGGNSYRLQRVVDKTSENIHHLIGKKYRYQYKTNAEENKVRISERKHIALNQFFGDKQSPREQLLEVFNLVKPVLTEGVKQELTTILNAPDDLFYIQAVLKGQKKKSEKSSNQSQESLFK